MTYEVVLHGLDKDLIERTEVYTTCETEEEAERAAQLLRRSMLPFVIEIRKAPDSQT